MSERIWTRAQLAAIGSKEKNLLVSAAAGSGKTATLTERIIRLICDGESGCDISRMLIVTFTKLAASELRERITAALFAAASKDPDNAHLSKQLSLIGSASICTIDSFALSLVRPMFSEVGLSADFRVGDQTEMNSLRREAMEEAVGYFYDTKNDSDEGFFALADAIGTSRDEDRIDLQMLDFENECESYGITADLFFDYADALERNRNADFFKTEFGSIVIRRIGEAAEHYGNISRELAGCMSEDEAMMKSYVPAALEMAEHCEKLVSAAGRDDTDRVRELCLNLPNKRMSLKSELQTNESAYFKNARAKYNQFLKKMNGEFFTESPEAISSVMSRTATVCRAAGTLISRFRDNYTRLKRQKSVVDFSDLTRLALALVCDGEGNLTPYGESVADRYTHVFIDEYQDTNELQDKLFSAVASKCGRFLVGDIKQSIYAFRGADPSVFARYRENWQSGNGGSTVFMSENFRSVATVLDFANAVSKYMFPFGKIPFSDDDLLRCGRNENGEACEVCIIDRGDNEDSKTELEARCVSERIRRMIDGGTKPDDIAILMRSTARKAEVYAAALAKQNIPVKNGGTLPLTERPEVLFLLCILRAADNPLRDTYLAGAMCSAAFGFTLGDVGVIRKLYPAEFLWYSVKAAAESDNAEHESLSKRCAAFCTFIAETSAMASVLSSAAIIDRLRNTPEVRGAIAVESGGGYDATTDLYELARQRRGNLYSFLSYISGAGKELSFSDDGESSGVSVMTMHKSKGLEFPVCFLVGCDAAQNKSDSKKTILIERGFGVSLKLCDTSGLVSYDNVLRKCALMRKADDDATEEMRVLYVAMTRAREKLIVTCTDKDPTSLLARCQNDSRYRSAYSVLGQSYIETVLSALNLYGGSFSEVKIDNADNTGDGAPQRSSDPKERSADAERIAEVLRERLLFEYPYEYLRGIPSKLTVSKLYPEILDENDTSAELETSEIEMCVPAFMSGTAYSPADAGSAAHLILQFCDFSRLNELGVGAELCRLRDLGFISDADAEAAQLEYIEKFRRSAFFRRILTAKSIRREFRFNAVIPAHTLTSDQARAEALKAADVGVTAQGVIDIVFTDSDGKLVLADYKTDRLSAFELGHRDAAAEKLWNRHRKQLGYYREVCSQLFGRYPDETVLYSMPLGEALCDPETR